MDMARSIELKEVSTVGGLLHRRIPSKLFFHIAHLAMWKKGSLPVLAEVLRLANKQGIEERSCRWRIRDGGLAAPAYCCDEES